MQVREVLNEQYAELCKKLGDFEYQKTNLEEKIKEVKEQIKCLDRAVPMVGNLEVKEPEEATETSDG